MQVVYPPALLSGYFCQVRGNSGKKCMGRMECPSSGEPGDVGKKQNNSCLQSTF